MAQKTQVGSGGSPQGRDFVAFPPGRQLSSDPTCMMLLAATSLFILLVAAVDPYPEESGPWLFALSLLCLAGTGAWFVMRVVLPRRRGSS